MRKNAHSTDMIGARMRVAVAPVGVALSFAIAVLSAS
jgi:hypothetical protein